MTDDVRSIRGIEQRRAELETEKDKWTLVTDPNTVFEVGMQMSNGNNWIDITPDWSSYGKTVPPVAIELCLLRKIRTVVPSDEGDRLMDFFFGGKK